MKEIKKIPFTKEWCLDAADHEVASSVGAGLLAFASSPEAVLSRQAAVEAEEGRVAFARFVQLMRRKHSLTVEGLAMKADVELADVLAIEEGLSQSPEPRTVYQLAQFFRVPSKALLQLAGLTKTKDPGFEHEAVRFAARSESIERLSKEESAALESFVAVLSQQD